jgi:hypothetical protein
MDKQPIISDNFVIICYHLLILPADHGFTVCVSHLRIIYIITVFDLKLLVLATMKYCTLGSFTSRFELFGMYKP